MPKTETVKLSKTLYEFYKDESGLKVSMQTYKKGNKVYNRLYLYNRRYYINELEDGSFTLVMIGKPAETVNFINLKDAINQATEWFNEQKINPMYAQYKRISPNIFELACLLLEKGTNVDFYGNSHEIAPDCIRYVDKKVYERLDGGFEIVRKRTKVIAHTVDEVYNILHRRNLKVAPK